jgi:hypothetical protein
MYVNQIFNFFITVGWADSCTNFFLAITFPIPNTKSIKLKEVRQVSSKFSCKDFFTTITFPKLEEMFKNS